METQLPEDDKIDLTNRLEVIRKVAEMEGAVLVEHFVCCRCGSAQQTIHLWLESLRCFRCGQMNASKIPRRPQVGEVSVDHLTQAMATYQAAYESLLCGRSISDRDLDCERIISSEDSEAVKFALKTIRRVAHLAEKLAAGEASGG